MKKGDFSGRVEATIASDFDPDEPFLLVGLRKGEGERPLAVYAYTPDSLLAGGRGSTSGRKGASLLSASCLYFKVPVKPQCTCKISERRFAVSEFEKPFDVTVYSIVESPAGGYEVERQMKLAGQCKGRTYALQAVPGSVSGDTESTKLISADTTGLATVWDIEKGTVLSHFPDPPKSARRIVICPTWNYDVYIGGFADPDLRRYDFEKNETLARGKGHTGGIWGIAADLEHGIVGTASYDKYGRIWSRKDLKCISQFSLGESAGSAYYAPDLGLFFVGIQDTPGTIQAWDPRKTTQAVRSFPTRTGNLFGGIVRIDHSTFACAGSSIASWTPEGQVLGRLRGGSNYYFGLCVFNTPYDRPPRVVLDSFDDVDERIEFLMTMQSGTTRRCAVGVSTISFPVVFC